MAVPMVHGAMKKHAAWICLTIGAAGLVGSAALTHAATPKPREASVSVYVDSFSSGPGGDWLQGQSDTHGLRGYRARAR